jgi:hypothetical protein
MSLCPFSSEFFSQIKRVSCHSAEAHPEAVLMKNAPSFLQDSCEKNDRRQGIDRLDDRTFVFVLSF